MPKETKKAPARKPAAARTRRKKTAPTHEQIAERAYWFHLEGAGDELANWLRAERELATG